jgi:hypothetical protein
MAELDKTLINNKVLFNIVDVWEAEHFNHGLQVA